MKIKFFNLCLMMFLVLNYNLIAQTSEENLYQVLSQDPHHLNVIKQHLKTVKKKGRLWLVKVRNSMPRNGYKYLKKLSSEGLGEVKHYLFQVPLESLQPKKLEVMKRIKFLDKQSIKQNVIELSSYTTRAAGSADNQRVKQKLSEAFHAYSFSSSEICYQPGKCSIVSERKGTQNPGDVILIIAHFDSVGKSFAGSDDNASGTAVLLEIAKSLQSYVNKKTIRFFATNGEELGLLGAKHYVKYLEGIGELKSIKLAINMDMVGYNQNGIVELETNVAFEGLAKWFAGLATKYTKLQTKITLGAWGSDHVPFLDKNIPTLLTIEDWSTKTPCYHQACDKPDTLNYDYALEIAKLNLAAILEKDDTK